ncbi:MAG: hypothetical protein P4M11_04060 [Candidatus Pacebacteria bacterium]|nr:hypothetical protein [Candidatus Paceibacterota bacterium]
MRRKKLEKKIAKLARTQGTQIDVFDVIKRDKSQNKFCDTIESCAMLREHFYDLLVDNEPSYEKFVMLGFAIKQTSARIKELWHSLKRSNTRLSLRMIVAYSGYHEQILQDAERAAKLRSNMLEEGVITEGDMLMQYAENGDAVAAVTTDSEGHATIVKHNCAFSELSGYTKEELANMPLERLIPKVCLPIHEAAFNKAVVMARSEKPMSFEQRPTVMLHRSGYIVPVIQRVVATPSYINSYCFIVKICKDKANNVYNLVHILADEARNIVGLSSSNEPNNRCIDASTMCGLSLDIINSTRINIYQLSADFLSIPEKTKVEINYNDNVQLLMSGTIDSLGKELISPICMPGLVIPSDSSRAEDGPTHPDCPSGKQGRV